MKLEERRDFHTAIMVRKCVYGLAPEYLTSTFKMRNMVDSNHNLRGFKKIFVQGQRRTGARILSVTEVYMTWNALPDQLREYESNHLFITRFMHTTETRFN